MQTNAIRLEGNIISADILSQIANGQANYQQASAFGFSTTTAVKNEIANVWALAKSNYDNFQIRRKRAEELGQKAPSVRAHFLLPLFQDLGYQPKETNSKILHGNSYNIRYEDPHRGNLPLMLLPSYGASLDKKPEHGLRMSPHAILQEYLNLTDQLFGLLCNGMQLRLLRDASRLSRLSFLEFDLQQIFEEDRYNDFALLFRLLHASRMPANPDETESSILEYYHQEALSSGARIRSRLSEAVEQAIKELGTAFLQQNPKLREELKANGLKEGQTAEELAQAYYEELQTLIYRLLFIMVIEERQLLYPKAQTEEEAQKQSRQRKIYYNYYSLQRLRQLSEKPHWASHYAQDVWQAVIACFKLFEADDSGEQKENALGISALGGSLFTKGNLKLLDDCQIDNRSFLFQLHRLNYFSNEKGQFLRVNYGALDVEEFGSVYEGLLEYKAGLDLQGKGEFYFKKGEERSSSGAHYTPDELVHPLLEHALAHLLKRAWGHELRLWQERKLTPAEQSLIEKRFLNIRICDPSCGSGHLLLAAARRLALELARVRSQEDQPAPSVYRKALRQVILHNVYGVDKNPKAVELCRLALWLEAHEAGGALGFLEHKIKAGDSVVGLYTIQQLEEGISDQAFSFQTGDDKALCKQLKTQNKNAHKNKDQQSAQFQAQKGRSYQSLLRKLEEVLALPENNAQELAQKKLAYHSYLQSQSFQDLKRLADAQIAPFFIRKKKDYQNALYTQEEYKNWLSGQAQALPQQKAHITAASQKQGFFHWFLAFPEVFAQNKGFDLMLGNPPFLGGAKISGHYGNDYLKYLHTSYLGAKGQCDFVAYFFRRSFALLKPQGFLSMISTNTIAQGDTRSGGLLQIYKAGGRINHAVRSMPWPGLAAVEVALVTIHKGHWSAPARLGKQQVQQISTYLDDSPQAAPPQSLQQNADQSFQGSIVLGAGFILATEAAQDLIEQDSKNKQVLFPYLNGRDLNNDPQQAPSRWVINFFDWPLGRYTAAAWAELTAQEQAEIIDLEEKGRFVERASPNYSKPVAEDYPDCLAILEERVKPERQRWKIGKDGRELVGTYALRSPLPERWWHYERSRPNLYKTIAPLKKVLVVAQVSKTVAFVFTPSGQVISSMYVAFSIENYGRFSCLQSTIHKDWVQKNGSALKNDLRYTPGAVYQTFPFPKSTTDLEKIGQQYYDYRQSLMGAWQIGLTALYNLFHAAEIEQASQQEYEQEPSRFKKRYGSSLFQLLEQGQELAQIQQSLRQFRALQQQLDLAVLRAYGWSDLLAMDWPLTESAQGQSNSLHAFYPQAYLPEKDNIRYSLHPAARKEVLQRLLALNHHYFEEELRQGLHKEATALAYYEEKGEELPQPTAQAIQLAKRKKKKSSPSKTKGQQSQLFEQGGKQGSLF